MMNAGDNNMVHPGTGQGIGPSDGSGDLNNGVGGVGMSEQDMMMARMHSQAGLGGMGGMGMPTTMNMMGGMNHPMMGGMPHMMSGMNHPMMGGMGMMPGMGMPFGPPQGSSAVGEMGDMNQPGFGSEFDYNMLQMIRKRNMMGNPSLLQQQYKNGMVRPEDFQVSSVMIDKLKRSGGVDSDDEDHKSKRRKKAKKPSDMPRRALSAYNIFFSEQRELVLGEIASKEKAQKLKEEGKDEDEIARILAEDAKRKEESKQKAAAGGGDDEDGGENEDAANAEDDAGGEGGEDGEEPKVMNRTFFPTRAKRAHRKVHGKIGLVSLAREVSARWKALSDAERRVYQDLAEKDRERHKKVMADYQERKAAENMISMGSPGHESQDAPAPPPDKLHLGGSASNGSGGGGVVGLGGIGAAAHDQELRDSVAQQHQQR